MSGPISASSRRRMEERDNFVVLTAYTDVMDAAAQLPVIEVTLRGRDNQYNRGLVAELLDTIEDEIAKRGLTLRRANVA